MTARSFDPVVAVINGTTYTRLEAYDSYHLSREVVAAAAPNFLVEQPAWVREAIATSIIQNAVHAIRIHRALQAVEEIDFVTDCDGECPSCDGVYGCPTEDEMREEVMLAGLPWIEESDDVC